VSSPSGLADDEAYFVYGIVPAGIAVPDGVVGLRDSPPLVLSSGHVAALVDVVDPDRPLGNRDDLLGYRRVLDSVASMTTVVPVSFGSVLPDGEAVTEDLLGPNHDHFAELLEYFQGRREYLLRARYHQDVVLAEIVAEQPEVADLREETRDLPEDATYPARVRLGELVAAALQEKRWADGERVVEHVAPYAVEHRVREPSGLEDMVEVALLVDNEHSAELESAAEELAEELHERARLQLTGPMPPYDFVQEA
jgi:hypothetical protein